MPKRKPLLSGVRGTVVALAITLLAFALLARVVNDTLGASEIATASANRIFICAETGQTFRHTLQLGDTLPVHSPWSGKPTGHPAELCNWTADGRVTDTFTPVLLNSIKGQPEPTFCPTCDRLVVPLNPPADGARRAPPTRSDYQRRLMQLAQKGD